MTTNLESQEEENPLQKTEGEEPASEAIIDPLEIAENALKECQERYVRLLAETENTRKRLFKERDEHAQFVSERLVVEFLQPLDSMENALKFAKNAHAEVRNWALGFEMILNQFKQVLTNQGIQPFSAIGKQFDPHCHEAVEAQESTEYKPGTILEEFVCGYKKGDRTIRVAKVKVAKKPEPAAEDSPPSHTNNS